MNLPHGRRPADLATGADLLADSLRNRGTGFSAAERDRFGIEGLLPPAEESLAQQTARVMANLRQQANPLDQYRYLRAIQDDNETLFHRALADHLAELLPIVYTPTVGQACTEWSRIYERPRGLYLTARQRGHIGRVLANWPQRDVRMIVITDGGRILGLGDLGANGMGIPIGKLALYTACAGVPPALTLPVTLDVGTDNEALRTHPLYLGIREPRLRGEAYDALMDECMVAIHSRFPRAVVQFEDFGNDCAFALLHRYRERVCCFNDDIQGTGAMALAGLYAAGRIVGRSLAAQRILFVGAGEACLGIGAMVATAMQREGLAASDAHARLLFMDSQGSVVAGRCDLAAHKRPFARDCPPVADLLTAIETFQPTALIGACGKGYVFTRPVLEAMARLNARPVVFALSNPTEKSECTAQQAHDWTEGRAIFASGSPFPAVQGGAGVGPSQANNAHLFPGMGLGLLASGASRVTDEMFLVAARELAAQAPVQQGCIFPPVSRMWEVAGHIALAVASVAYERGLATVARPVHLQHAIEALRYRAGYESMAKGIQDA